MMRHQFKSIRVYAWVVLLALALLAPVAHGDVLPLEWISSYGTPINLWNTSTSGSIPIGFEFEFYGEAFSTVNFSGNGYIGIGDLVVNSGNPTSWPLYNWQRRYSKIVAPLWEDWGWGSTVYTYYNTVGSPGARRFVVTWITPDAQGRTNTFQGQLLEGSNQIIFCYDILPLNPSPTALTPVGVNYGDGIRHTSFEYDKQTNGGIGPYGSLEDHTIYMTYNSGTGDYDLTSRHAPEPGTLALMLGGSALLLRLRRRQQKS